MVQPGLGVERGGVEPPERGLATVEHRPVHQQLELEPVDHHVPYLGEADGLGTVDHRLGAEVYVVQQLPGAVEVAELRIVVRHP